MKIFMFHGMDIFQFFVWFFIYSFLGWGMECVVIRRQKGYWENRGFAKLPFCVIYGFGVFIACYLFAPIQHNYAALYVWGCIGATVFEYIVAMAMMKLFGEVWWNYDHLKFNYKGILCLESTLAWGLLALIIFGYFNIRLESFVMHINHRYVMIMGTALPIMYVTDFTYHFITRLRDNRSSMAEFQEDADKVKEIKKC